MERIRMFARVEYIATASTCNYRMSVEKVVRYITANKTLNFSMVYLPYAVAHTHTDARSLRMANGFSKILFTTLQWSKCPDFIMSFSI